MTGTGAHGGPGRLGPPVLLADRGQLGRGPPRLRMRHARFVIDEAARDAWLRHMRTSLDELALNPELDAMMWDYLVMAAHSLLNRPTAPPAGHDLGLTPR